ncbi:hypothetical protein [Absidia glauca]|uniref:Uncharacterized protein n=1 Tax=Absidia glauca TaxID=4829 RepID=A0A163KBM3_ABSGL|nr:hypothetical protein [Absidia glauca]
MNQNYEPGAPPPTYQQEGARPGQTYYQPPPQPQNMGGQQQPPPAHNQPLGNVQRKIVRFYSPPQNNRLGMRRRLLSLCCCFIFIGLIVGLVAGLVTRSQHNSYYYGGSSTSCRSNNDCYYRYGKGFESKRKMKGVCVDHTNGLSLLFIQGVVLTVTVAGAVDDRMARNDATMETDDEDVLLSYYLGQDDYERRPSSSSTASSSSSSSSSSSKQPSIKFISSVRHSLRLSTLFTLRRRRSSFSPSTSIPSFARFSLPACGTDDPLSPKQLEIERLIAAHPERTVRLSITPEFAI